MDITGLIVSASGKTIKRDERPHVVKNIINSVNSIDHAEWDSGSENWILFYGEDKALMGMMYYRFKLVILKPICEKDFSSNPSFSDFEVLYVENFDEQILSMDLDKVKSIFANREFTLIIDDPNKICVNDFWYATL